jgi:hypothetical protein
MHLECNCSLTTTPQLLTRRESMKKEHVADYTFRQLDNEGLTHCREFILYLLIIKFVTFEVAWSLYLQGSWVL